jgi:hypothetical protein
VILQNKYQGTFYSDVTLPNFKGTLSQDIDIQFASERENPLLRLIISPTYILKEIGGDFKHDVLKSQSIFDLITDGTLTINELYNITREAINHLRLHLVNKNMPNNLKEIGDPPLSEVLASLMAILTRFQGNQ